MNFLKFIVKIVQLLIAYKVIVLLYKTYDNYASTYTQELLWWSCLLIFDIWIIKNFVTEEDVTEDKEDSI